jgi:putative flippase GtrA
MEYKMKNKKEIINYLIFGVLTTVVNIVSYSLFVEIIGMDYKLATTLAWFISVIFAFITNKHFVYNSKKRDFISVARELVSFSFFRILSYIIDLGMMIVLVEGIHLDSILAKVFANIIVVIINYFASKFFVFQPKK